MYLLSSRHKDLQSVVLRPTKVEVGSAYIVDSLVISGRMGGLTGICLSLLLQISCLVKKTGQAQLI